MYKLFIFVCIFQAIVAAGPRYRYILLNSSLVNLNDTVISDKNFYITRTIAERSIFPQIQSLIKIDLQEEVITNNRDIRLALIIAGEFDYDSVKRSENVTLKYWQFRMALQLFNRFNRFTLVLVGPGAKLWTQRCIADYDFDLYEILALSANECLHLGYEEPFLQNCQRIQINAKFLDPEKKSGKFSFDPGEYQNFTIIVLNNMKVYINASTNSTYIDIDGKYNQYGIISEQHPFIPFIMEIKWKIKTITISYCCITISRSHTRQVARYNFRGNYYYFGELRNDVEHGMGVYVEGNITYMGTFKQGKKNGKGILMDCNPEEACRKCQQELFANKVIINIDKSQSQKYYIGKFKNNFRSHGIYKLAMSIAIGNWVRGTSGYTTLDGFGTRTLYTADDSQYLGIQIGYYKLGVLKNGHEITKVAEFKGSKVFRMNYGDWYGKGQLKSKSVNQFGQLQVEDIIYGNLDQLVHFDKQKQLCMVRSQRGRYFYIGEIQNRVRSGRGYICRQTYDYKGMFRLDNFHGFGVQNFFDGSLYRQGIFYAGKFIKGYQRFRDYEMEGTFAYETQRTDNTMLLTKDRVMVGRAGKAREIPLINNEKVQASPTQQKILDSGAYEQGQSLMVEWVQLEL